MAVGHTFAFLLSWLALGLNSSPEQLSRIAVLQVFTQHSKLLCSFGLCENQGFQHFHTSAKRQLKNRVSNSAQWFTVLHSTFMHVSQKYLIHLPLSTQCEEWAVPLWDRSTFSGQKNGSPWSSDKCQVLFSIQQKKTWEIPNFLTLET